MAVLIERLEPVLGTVLEVQARAGRRARRRLIPVLLAEIARLEAIFSIFQPGSELCRWRSGPSPASVSAELAQLLEAAFALQVASGGIFNPATGEVTALWKEAEATGVPPPPEGLAHAAAAIRDPRFTIDGRVATQLGDCGSLNFNALAKGLVVDLAAQRVVAEVGPSMLMLNIGGDLRHYGEGQVRIGVENPLRPFDNEPPLTQITVSNAAAATSGFARRGFRVDGEWYSHVIDPRTAQPVDTIASATVIAPSALQADGIATVLSVLGPSEGLAFADHHPSVSACVVAADGSIHTNARWAQAPAAT